MNRERAIELMLTRFPVYVVDGDDHRIHQATIAEVSVERKADLRYPPEVTCELVIDGDSDTHRVVYNADAIHETADEAYYHSIARGIMELQLQLERLEDWRREERKKTTIISTQEKRQ